MRGYSLAPMKPDDALLRADELLVDSRWIHRIARSLLTDPSSADDLVQEAWVAALAQAQAQRDEKGSTRSWLARVLRNLADKHWRSEARRRSREMTCARGESVASTADLVARAEMQRLVVEAVIALPEPYRTTILRAHIEGLTSVEIARSQSVSENTVRWRIQRGLSLLRFELERRRGREWLSGCAMLLAPADRVVVAGVIKAAAAGIIAVVTPKVAVATLTALAVAGAGAAAWRVHESASNGDRTQVALADVQDPSRAEPSAGDASPELALIPLYFGKSDAESLAHGSTLEKGAHGDAEALGMHLRMAVEKAIGPSDSAKLMSDSTLTEIRDALESAGVDPASVDAKLMSGATAVLALDVSAVENATVGVGKPRVFIGLRAVPPR